MAGLDYVNPYGITDLEPGAVSVINVEEESKAQAIHTTAIAFIGRSLFGKPQLPGGSGIMSFTRPEVARKILGNCPSTNLMEKMWKPSKDLLVRGAYVIDFIRNGTPTQAALSLLNGVASVLSVASVQYGAEANKVAVRVVANGALRDVYTSYKGGTPIAYRDLGRALLIHYVGSGSASTLTITRNVSDDAITLTTTCTGATADNLTIDLQDFKTISGLAGFIDSHANYTCQVVATANGNLPVRYLDPYGSETVAVLDIKTTAANVDAKLGSIVYATRNDPYAIIARVAAAKLPPDAIATTNLAGATGGIDDTINAASVATALDYLEAQNRTGGMLFVESDDIAVQLTVAAWIDEQRLQGHRWRYWTAVAILDGDGDPTTDDDRCLQLQQINHVHTCATTIGIRHRNYLGEFDYKALYHAAQLCGADAGSGLLFPLTRKSIDVLGTQADGVEKKLTKEQRNRYISCGGITPFWQDRPGGGWQTNMAITTSTADDKRMNKMAAERRFIDAVNDRIEARLEMKFVGQFATPTFVSGVRAEVYDELDFWTKPPNDRLAANPNDPSSKPFEIGTISTNAGTTQAPWSGGFVGENDHVETIGQLAYVTIESVATANLNQQ